MAEVNQAAEAGRETMEEKARKVRLILLDRETGEERVCTLDEVETWDWTDPEIWRIVNGWQIASFGELVYLLSLKADKGVEEMQMLQSPRFMMLAGG